MNHLKELTSQNDRFAANVEDSDLNLLAPKEVREVLVDSSAASVGMLRHDNVEFINNFVFASVEDELEEDEAGVEEVDGEELEDDLEYEEVDEEEGGEEDEEYEYVDDDEGEEGEDDEEYEYEYEDGEEGEEYEDDGEEGGEEEDLSLIHI